MKTNNKEVYIIGGGPSLKNYDFAKLYNKDTIAINKAIYYVQNPNYFITMDHSVFKKMDRSILQNISATKIFIANLSYPYMVEQGGKIVDSRYNIIYNLKEFDMIIKSYRRRKFGFSFNDFRNGDNSGYCALQLAIILGYETIYLLGFDLKNENIKTHFHGGYGESYRTFSQKLDKYFTFFRNGFHHLKKQNSKIKIYNCSKDSLLKDLLPYKEL